jgi:hypothetical protein
VVAKVEGMEQGEVVVVAVVVKGGAGNDLPRVFFSMISYLKGTLSRYSFRIMGVSHGSLKSRSILLRTKLKNEESWEYRIRLVSGLFPR